ncbi:hypothetical protein PVAP13_3NG298850 [Panicum virgatum]|uniref:Uncharacterized protein n=1 Tax=Panicum virgatum TaxID=38727 RepID=A0A8T0UJZ6_PANVG|nr:hypothetical protein PVAP13_3NG298850 [Panicum virgatum]
MMEEPVKEAKRAGRPSWRARLHRHAGVCVRFTTAPAAPLPPTQRGVHHRQRAPQPSPALLPELDAAELRPPSLTLPSLRWRHARWPRGGPSRRRRWPASAERGAGEKRTEEERGRRRRRPCTTAPRSAPPRCRGRSAPAHRAAAVALLCSASRRASSAPPTGPPRPLCSSGPWRGGGAGFGRPRPSLARRSSREGGPARAPVQRGSPELRRTAPPAGEQEGGREEEGAARAGRSLPGQISPRPRLDGRCFAMAMAAGEEPCGFALPRPRSAQLATELRLRLQPPPTSLDLLQLERDKPPPFSTRCSRPRPRAQRRRRAPELEVRHGAGMDRRARMEGEGTRAPQCPADRH